MIERHLARSAIDILQLNLLSFLGPSLIGSTRHFGYPTTVGVSRSSSSVRWTARLLLGGGGGRFARCGLHIGASGRRHTCPPTFHVNFTKSWRTGQATQRSTLRMTDQLQQLGRERWRWRWQAESLARRSTGPQTRPPSPVQPRACRPASSCARDSRRGPAQPAQPLDPPPACA